jgi:hypothetical protein
MDDPNDLRELAAQVARLVTKLEAPKKKDWADRLAVIGSFLSTVVVALLGLYYTQSAQRAQLGVQQAQVRIEEMKALTSIAPLLASPDSAQRAVAQTILDAVNDTHSGTAAAAPASAGEARPVAEGGSFRAPAGGGASLSLLDSFIRRAKDAQQSDAGRVAALREIQKAATAPAAPPSVRAKALDAASEVAVMPGVPETVRRAAGDVIAGIQNVPADRIASVIDRTPLRRHVAEIIVHHTGNPVSSYRGAPTMLSLAQLQLGQMGWRNVSWHYAIAPDGSVWLGMPLDEKATHTPRHNDLSVSVLLLLDGSKELPTPAQQRTFGLVMRTLQAKAGLAAGAPGAVVRHADISTTHKTCPGELITREALEGWIQDG